MLDGMQGDFGTLLRRQRRAAGLTQEELAAQAGLSARGIADLERGTRRTPRRDTIALLVRALGVSPEDEAAMYAAARRSRAPAPVAPPMQRLASDIGPAARRQAPSNLPAQLTQLLGRDEIGGALVAFMRRADVRLVTLTGPGGIGKTRVAMQVAADLLNDFADGVWFVRLSRLTDPRLVIPTIAQTLSLKEMGSQAISEGLRDHLRQRCLLLVLDNCEHVAAAAPDIADLLANCPAINVLATSRAALRLRGEREYPIPPLALPPGAPGATLAPDRLADYPAVALFAERARAARPDFAVTMDNAAVVTQICARLDGLPLAIELAAARVKLLPLSALLAQLTHDLGFLAGGARDLDERQQAMRGALAWSERLLSDADQALFRRLAVFAGGCALEAAEAVCMAPEGAEPLHTDLLDGLGALVEQNLISQREEGGEARFGMLHVIREYALERLEASGEAEALRRAHAACMLALAERAEPELTGPDAVIWLGRLEREHDNLRAALGWALEREEVEIGLRLVASVFRFWVARGHLREGRAWASRLLAQSEDEDTAAAQSSGARRRALFAAGVLALYSGDEATAETWLEQAAASGRAEGDLRTAANALSSLGVAATHQGQMEQAKARLEASLALARVLGEQRGLAVVLTNLGIVVYAQGDLAQAAPSFSEALAIARQLGDRDLMATSLANLSSVALRRGEIPQAEDMGREALALYRALGDSRRCAVGLEALASSAGMAGQGARAARLLGAATALRETLGAPLPAYEQDDLERFLAAGRAALGEARWALAITAGRALPLDEAIAEALDEDSEQERGSADCP